MKTFVNTYFSETRETELIAVQVAGPGDWDECPPTFHQIPREMVGMFGQFLSNAVDTQIRLTFPRNENQDVSWCNGSYFSPDRHKLKSST